MKRVEKNGLEMFLYQKCMTLTLRTFTEMKLKRKWDINRTFFPRLLWTFAIRHDTCLSRKQVHVIKKKMGESSFGQQCLWNINLSINNTLSNINKICYYLAVWSQYKSRDHSASQAHWKGIKLKTHNNPVSRQNLQSYVLVPNLRHIWLRKPSGAKTNIETDSEEGVHQITKISSKTCVCVLQKIKSINFYLSRGSINLSIHLKI